MLSPVPFRILVHDAPIGVQFALQSGTDQLLQAVIATAEDLQFEFDLRVQLGPDALPNFLGPCAQGPRDARFVYLGSGTRAGQLGTPWDRRAKLGLRTIGWDLLDQLEKTPGGVLETLIPGRAKDGGPVCASIPVTWRIAGG